MQNRKNSSTEGCCNTITSVCAAKPENKGFTMRGCRLYGENNRKRGSIPLHQSPQTIDMLQQINLIYRANQFNLLLPSATIEAPFLWNRVRKTAVFGKDDDETNKHETHKKSDENQMKIT